MSRRRSTCRRSGCARSTTASTSTPSARCPASSASPTSCSTSATREDRNKGARYFLKALDLLKDEIDFRVTFVDNAKHNLKLAPRLVDEYGLNSRIDFTGRIPTDDLVRHYNEAKLLVTSSVHEGFGLPLAEAMSCGTPTVATDIGAYREIVEHGKSGWLVPPSDPQALADAIRMMWNDAGLRQRLCEGGRQRILEKFNWRKAAEETLAVYEEIVPAKRRTLRDGRPGRIQVPGSKF